FTERWSDLLRSRFGEPGERRGRFNLQHPRPRNGSAPRRAWVGPRANRLDYARRCEPQRRRSLSRFDSAGSLGHNPRLRIGRHQDSDFGRMARQQQVIDAIIARVLQPAMIWRLPSILDTVSKSVRTNVAPADGPALALSLTNLSAPNVRRLVIGPDLVTPLAG